MQVVALFVVSHFVLQTEWQATHKTAGLGDDRVVRAAREEERVDAGAVDDGGGSELSRGDPAGSVPGGGVVKSVAR